MMTGFDGLLLKGGLILDRVGTQRRSRFCIEMVLVSDGEGLRLLFLCQIGVRFNIFSPYTKYSGLRSKGGPK